MSLIDSMMESCVLMDKTRVPDGQGGFNTTWRESVDISVAIVMDTSLEARNSERSGFVSNYTLTTKKENKLGYNDIIKRKSDGQYFRITAVLNSSPAVSTLDISQYSAERWEMTE